ncbi:nucleolar protein 7 [Entelurus aequoreus]|uniref:nucleolar protein 7 n=1 Tax=Entelurus aequoreus TaxID=161455 RepID=UPI002B1D0354|nr:nucleolar protein 7 [Entelurus aequoreus]
MATRQRGQPARLTKKQKNENAVKTFVSAFDSSEDEGPEEVTFEDSKAEALQSVEQALQSARREKDLLKEKRKKRQELFQEQKKRKLLSDEVLEEIDSSQKSHSDEVQDASVTFQDEVLHMDEETKQEKQKLENSRKLIGNYKVTVKPSELASSQQKMAEDFIQSRLYGPGSLRTTSNQLLSLHNKRAINKSAAVEFTKKNWAEKRKSKAEMKKMRWRHKHIPSS